MTAPTRRAPVRIQQQTDGPKPVLFIGDQNRLQYVKISTSHLVTPALAPDLKIAEAMTSTPGAWGTWEGVVLDGRCGTDVQIERFVQRHGPRWRDSGLTAVVVMDDSLRHLTPNISTYAQMVDAGVGGSRATLTDDIAGLLGLSASKQGRKVAHIACLSAKGGSGKSSTALALALMIARLRRDLPLVLVDADFFNGSVAHALGVAGHAKSFVELMAAVEDHGLTNRVLQEHLTKTPHGIDIIAAPPNANWDARIINAPTITRIYDQLHGIGKSVIITDVPPDIRQSTVVAPVFFGPDRVNNMTFLLLCGPRMFESHGFTNMAGFLREHNNANRRAWLVYMQTRPYREKTDKSLMDNLASIADENGLAGVAGMLPYNLVVEDAQRNHVPYWQVPPENFMQGLQWRVQGGNPFVVAATQLAKRVLKIAGLEE